MASAKCEYMGEFRDDVAIFLPPELIDNLIVRGRFENIPRPQTQYHAFCDLSGGRNDAAALAIAHKDNRKIVLDLIKNFPAPHNPHQVIADMVAILREWQISRITADAYAGEFASAAFQALGIAYQKAKKNKSELYAELLPLISSGQVELLDNKLLVKQLCALERRTRAGGKDTIDHPPRGHDDSANALAGVAFVTNAKRLRLGVAL
jgi:hypothetical protein